jgi:hypothetical protein
MIFAEARPKKHGLKCMPADGTLAARSPREGSGTPRFRAACTSVHDVGVAAKRYARVGALRRVASILRSKPRGQKTLPSFRAMTTDGFYFKSLGITRVGKAISPQRSDISPEWSRSG